MSIAVLGTLTDSSNGVLHRCRRSGHAQSLHIEGHGHDDAVSGHIHKLPIDNTKGSNTGHPERDNPGVIERSRSNLRLFGSSKPQREKNSLAVGQDTRQLVTEFLAGGIHVRERRNRTAAFLHAKESLKSFI